MYEMAKKARDDMKGKAQRLAGPIKGAVDASGWSEPTINAECQTGLKPISRRQFKAGGAVSGSPSLGSAARPARKSGGSVARADGGKTSSTAAGSYDDESMAAIKAGKRLAGGSDRASAQSWAQGRKSGGSVANDYVNRDVKEANAEKFGADHIGGLKSGGRAKKAFGGGLELTDPRAAAAARMASAGAMANVPTSVMNFGKSKPAGVFGAHLKRGGAAKRRADGGNVDDNPQPRESFSRAVQGEDTQSAGTKVGMRLSGGGDRAESDMRRYRKDGGRLAQEGEGFRPTGDRIARKKGGRAKGKTNINIVIGHPGGGAAPMPPGGGPIHPPMPPVTMPPPSMPNAGPPMPMPSGPPPLSPAPMMGRKRGGRAYPIDDGSGGGLGRLEKKKAYGLKPPKAGE